MQAIHPLGAGESIAIGLGAALVVMLPVLWSLANHFGTMGHEGAHALTAFLLGLTVTEILLDRKGDGLTRFAGEGLRVTLVVLVGYLGPSLFGLGAAWLIADGKPVAVLWLLMVLLVVLFFTLGRSFGVFSVAVAIFAGYLIVRYTHAGTEVALAYAVTWLLLLTGVRRAIIDGVDAGDAHHLRGRTHLPRRVWALVWLGGTVAALLVGGKFLVLGLFPGPAH